MSSVDIEKQEKLDPTVSNTSVQNVKADDPSAPFYLKVVKALFSQAETKGIERVTEEERTDPSIWTAASMWLSANMVIATYSLGALGPTIFGLTFYQSMVTIIFFVILGALPVSLFSVFGSKFGLRQMVLSRFLIGNITTRVFALINMVACVGWGAVNIVASVKLLNVINNGALPPWAGCLVLVFATIFVSFFGYRVIHYYEMVAWIPNFIIFFIIIARFTMSGMFTGDAEYLEIASKSRFPGGETVVGNVLSFGCSIFGFATGWTTYAADYTVYMPKNTSSVKMFFGVLAGLCFPLFFAMILGAACGTAVLKNPDWAELYDAKDIGGLVYSILVIDNLHEFGSFCCVVLALSTVANNVPNMYSIALSAQTLWSPLAKVPRVVWTICGNFATLAICIPCYYKFDSFMTTFMGLISYYLAIYMAMAFAEHFVFRKGFSGYNYLDYDNPAKYPVGLAGMFGFCCGVAGVVVGMNISWYQGPIGRNIGAYGGDVGFELGFAFALVGYLATRPFELKYIGR
ncbi:purine-cytosine permease [Saccharomycopsis crataegensis]|uniref:Purine-cytosine permease n=1 Tax=Saccharomycopsis crataegensis TaxID=43959 RepID=A0AAV5QQ34_9ASCO|nr:purine-cytosine permease [Saccharomycopsis crataegensis]